MFILFFGPMGNTFLKWHPTNVRRILLLLSLITILQTFCACRISILIIFNFHVDSTRGVHPRGPPEEPTRGAQPRSPLAQSRGSGAHPRGAPKAQAPPSPAQPGPGPAQARPKPGPSHISGYL